MTWHDRLLSWIQPEDNPRNTVYGTIAAGLVVAAEDPTTTTYRRVLAATVVAVATYWLAHGYAHWFAERSSHRAAPTARGLVDALGHEWPLIEGAAIPLAALVIAWAVGAPLPAGDAAALWTAVGALVVFELAGGLRQRLEPLQLLGTALVGLVLGGALLVVKNLLH